MQKEKRDVARLKEEFAESLQKVKDQSAALLAESQADVRKCSSSLTPCSFLLARGE